MIFNVVSQVFGIIVIAIAIQFMVEGLGHVIPNWLEGLKIRNCQGEKRKYSITL